MPKIEPSHVPVGSPDAIAKAGQSPELWGSCAPTQKVHPKYGEIPGCPFWGECEFPKDRPRNYAVYIETADGNSRQNVTSCFSYMGSLFHRAKHQEESKEIIAILGEEGDEYEDVVTLSKDPINCNKTMDMQLVTSKTIRKVPRFPQPGEEGSLIPPNENDTRAHAMKMVALQRQRSIERRIAGNRDKIMVDDDAVAAEAQEAPLPHRGPGRPRKEDGA